MGTRSFIAIEIDSREARTAIRTIQNQIHATDADLKCVKPENVHITLKFLGDVPDHLLPQVKQAVEELTFQPLNLELKGVGVFPHPGRPQVIWAGTTGDTRPLEKVYLRLEKALEPLGFKPGKRRFHPHATLCRVRTGKNRAQLMETVAGLQDQWFGKLHVAKLYLKKSTLTPKGPIYTTLSQTKTGETGLE